MGDILARGTMFPQELVTDMFNAVKGSSSIANLCGATPIPFNGLKEFTFTMDKEVDLVAENGAKSKGGVTVEPTTIVGLPQKLLGRLREESRKRLRHYGHARC